MTGELVTTENFQEIPVRIVQGEKDRMIPLVDIAAATGYDRSTINQIIDRNPDVFEGLKGMVVIPTRGGMQEVSCLTRDGVIGLLIKISSSRIKDKNVRAKVVAFQRWAIETLGKAMDGNFAGASKIGISSILEDHLRMARALTEYAGVKPGIASAVAISVVQEKTGQDLTWCKNLLPPAQDPPGQLIPTEIGIRLGVTARQVNLLLENLKYQVRQGDTWYLTGAGKFWGEEYPYSRNGHSGYQIRWKPEIVGKLETVLHRTRQLQTGLLLGEMGS